jgi:hypothetical protein
MKTTNKTKRTLGLILFSVGLVLSMALSAVAIAGDLEANLFDSGLAHMRDASLTLRCPVMITAPETGSVRAAFKNPLDKTVEFTIRTHISQFIPMWREMGSKLTVEAGETESMEWTVTSDDMVQGRMILVKVLRFRKYPLPARLGSCGILVVGLPFLTGNLITALVIAASLLCMAGGAGLWILGSQPLSGLRQDAVRAMGVLAGVVLAGLVVSLYGAWLLGLLFLVATLLLIGAVAGHFVNRLRREKAG